MHNKIVLGKKSLMFIMVLVTIICVVMSFSNAYAISNSDKNAIKSASWVLLKNGKSGSNISQSAYSQFVRNNVIDSSDENILNLHKAVHKAKENGATLDEINTVITDAEKSWNEFTPEEKALIGSDGNIDPSGFREDKEGVDEENKIGEFGTQIVTIVRNIGYAIAGIIILILGVKYLMGSVEQKAEYKKTMVPYLVGAGLLFGVSTVITVVMSIGNTFAS